MKWLYLYFGLMGACGVATAQYTDPCSASTLNTDGVCTSQCYNTDNDCKISSSSQGGAVSSSSDNSGGASSGAWVNPCFTLPELSTDGTCNYNCWDYDKDCPGGGTLPVPGLSSSNSGNISSSGQALSSSSATSATRTSWAKADQLGFLSIERNRIAFVLPAKGAWTLDLLDVAGKHVLRLGEGMGLPGSHELSVNLSFLSGNYFLRIGQNGVSRVQVLPAPTKR